MRWLGLVVCFVASVADAKPSNPAFLGIEMVDLRAQVPTTAGPSAPAGPCVVKAVTHGSGAMAAGLVADDILSSIGGTPVASCADVLTAVQAHEPGDIVKIEVHRCDASQPTRFGGCTYDPRPLTLTATLVSRDEILRRRIVGQALGATELYGVEDQRRFDLGSLRGKTAIVGWFDARHCDGCSSVFTKVADWSRAQGGKPGAQLLAFAVTASEIDQVSSLKSITLDVPLTVADPELYAELTIPDTERIHFMIVDCRGIVQYVAPVAPNSDDTDAVLDELFAAAEQASRRSSKSAAR